MSRAVALLLLTAVAVGLAAAAEPDWYYLNPDSMPRLPTNKLFYLEQKHGRGPIQRDDGDSLNVRLVGKWGGGPSWGVTGKDTLVYLSRGSEVAVINFADTDHPQILNYIQAKRLAGRPVLVDTLLYLATSGYIEVFNVKDPTNAPRVGRLATPVSGIDIDDTLLYTISADTFRVFDFADPANPHLVGACADSGYALDYDGGYAYLRDRWGMYILDVRDPVHPRRVASWGTDVAGVKVRGHHCYVAQGSMGSGNLYVLNVSNPASPWQEGVLSGVACQGIYLVDTLLFTPESYIVNIADSSRPTLVSQVTAGGGEAWVHPSLRWGVTAGWTGGLRVLNLTNITQPVLDTALLGVDGSVDITVRQGVACVASYSTGVVILDVSDPVAPREIGRYDSAEASRAQAVVLTDSLLYMGGFLTSPPVPREILHAVDINDPTRPRKVGLGAGYNPVEAMALRDSLLYCAEDYKFEVFNVASPRQPVWRGRCDAYESVTDACAQGNYVYVTPRLQVFDVTNPALPLRISQTPGVTTNGGLAVRDTFAYVAAVRDSLWVFNIKYPSMPYLLGGVSLGNTFGCDVTLRGSYAHVGCDDYRLFDISAPAAPRPAGYYATPYRVRKVDCDSTYIYAACYLAGVCVLEQLPAGVAEPKQGEAEQARKGATVVRGVLFLPANGEGRIANGELLDVSGRKVMALHPGANDVRALAPGVYFVREQSVVSSQHSGPSAGGCQKVVLTE